MSDKPKPKVFTIHLLDGYYVEDVEMPDSKNMMAVISKVWADARIKELEAMLKIAVEALYKSNRTWATEALKQIQEVEVGK